MRTPRPSPIVIGLAAVAITVIGGEVYLLVRARADAPAASEPLPLVEAAPSATAATAVPPPMPPPRPPAASRRRLQAVALAEPPATPAAPATPAPTPSPVSPPVATAHSPADAGADGPRISAAVLRKRDQLLASHKAEQRRQADEQVFETMKLPETTRAAVRQINADAAKKVDTYLRAQPDDLTSDEQIAGTHANADEAYRAREAALSDLLGPDGLKDFEGNEFSSERRLHRLTRKDWNQQLEKEAPLPKDK